MTSQTELIRQQQAQQRQLQRQTNRRLQQQILQQGSAVYEQQQKQLAEKQKAEAEKQKKEIEKQQVEYQQKQQDYEQQKVDYENAVARVQRVNAAIEEIDDLHEIRGEDANYDPIYKKYGAEVYREASRIFRSNITRGRGDIGLNLPSAPTAPSALTAPSGEVFIGGQGFSVAPEYQKEFVGQQQQLMGIPTLPSVFAPKPQPLKEPQTYLEKDGTSPLQPGILGRTISRVPSPKDILDTSRGITSDIFGYFKKGFKEEKQKDEVFVSGFGGTQGSFFTPSPYGGTPAITPVTPSIEVKKVDTKPKPSGVFDIAKPIPSYIGEKGLLSFGGAVKGTGGLIAGDIKSFFTGGATTKYKGVGEWFKPFEDVGKAEKFTPAYVGYTDIQKEMSATSAIIGTPVPYVKDVTYGDIQREIEVKRKPILDKIENKHQKLLDTKVEQISNRKDLNEGEKQELIKEKTAKINSQLQREYNKVYSKYKDVPDLYRREGSLIPRVGGLALDIGASFGGIITPTIPMAYFTSKGLYKGAQTPTKQEAFADLNKLWADVLAGKPKGELTSPLYEEFKAKKGEAGLSLLIGLGAGTGIPEKISKSMTQARIDQLKKTKWSFSARKLTEKNGRTFIKIDASKSAWGTASAEAEVLVPIRQLKNGRFIVETGKGIIKVRVVDASWTSPSDILKKTVKFTTAARGETSKAFIKTPIGNLVIDDINMYVSSGSGYIAPLGDDVIQPFAFGSVSAGKGETYDIVSGDIFKLRGYATGRTTALVRPTATGTLKDVSTDFADDFAGTIITGGKKSSKQFVQQLYKHEKAQVETFTGKLLGTAEKFTTKGLVPSVGAKDITKQVSSVLVGSQATKVDTKLDTSFIPKVKTGLLTRTAEDTKVVPASGLDSFSGLVLDTGITTAVVPISKSAQELSQPQKQTQSLVPVFPQPSISLGFALPTPPTPFTFGFPTFGKRAIPLAKQKGWNVHVKSKGRFRKITKTPLTRINALNLGANVTDKTLSAQFSIKRSKKPAQQPRHKIPQNYWAESFSKFRPYKVRKGVKQPFTNRYIEKAPYRLDTRSEVQKISVAKFMKGLSKPKKQKRKQKNIGLKILTGF